MVLRRGWRPPGSGMGAEHTGRGSDTGLPTPSLTFFKNPSFLPVTFAAKEVLACERGKQRPLLPLRNSSSEGTSWVQARFCCEALGESLALSEPVSPPLLRTVSLDGCSYPSDDLGNLVPTLGLEGRILTGAVYLGDVGKPPWGWLGPSGQQRGRPSVSWGWAPIEPPSCSRDLQSCRDKRARDTQMGPFPVAQQSA